VTLRFAFLILFLAGATVALVTGLVRRALRAGSREGRAPAAAHHHWQVEATPLTDLAVSFVTVFGLVAYLVHDLARLKPPAEAGIGVAAAVVGSFALRAWMCRGESCHQSPSGETATVVRDIPAEGYGQVEMEVDGNRVTLAARSEVSSVIPAGSKVMLVDRQESVVVVRPARDNER
jgi:membrane protein implicated in regulation of membrane protease activity